MHALDTVTSPVEKPLLEILNLTVLTGGSGRSLPILDDVSFSVGPGETFCLVGESGCGKSMTALSILRLLPTGMRIDRGSIRLSGDDLVTKSERDLTMVRGKSIGMIFQEPMTSFNPVMTIGEQVAEPLRVHQKVSKSEARLRALEVMTLAGIPGAEMRYSQYPHELSGGLRQRAMIAMAIILSPSLLIADEPTTALDATIQAQILELLLRLKKEKKMSLLLITHDLGVVAEMADRVAVMYAGEIVETGSASEILSSPLHPYTRALRAAAVRPGPRSIGGKLATIPGRVPSPQELSSYCRFYDRCASAAPECKAAHPALREFPKGRQARCVRA